MSDPLSLLPFALAARGGRIDDIPVEQTVAAGVTLLRRSVPVVRALTSRRSAILLPTSPAFLTALAASDGRGAVLVNPLAAPREIAHQFADANVGVVFTNSALATRLPAGFPHVLLDDAPRTAKVVIGGESRSIDLGEHFGLELEGDETAEGADEEAAIVYTSAMNGSPLGAILTHRNLIGNARATVDAAGFSRDDVTLSVLPYSHLFGLVVTGAAPLLAGGRVVTMGRFNAVRAIEFLEQGAITSIMGVPAVFAAIIALLAKRRQPLRAPALRLSICGGAVLPGETQDRWTELTGVELRQGYGLTEAGPVCLCNGVSEPNRRGTLGSPLPGIEVSIRHPVSYSAGSRGTPERPMPETAHEVEGEICVRGGNVFRGYVGDRPGLEVRGGWLHTGDRGRMHASGVVRFTVESCLCSSSSWPIRYR